MSKNDARVNGSEKAGWIARMEREFARATNRENRAHIFYKALLVGQQDKTFSEISSISVLLLYEAKT